jgi:hypothetical protein
MTQNTPHEIHRRRFGCAFALAAAAAHADIVTPVGQNQPLILDLSWSATTMGTQSPATITGNPGNGLGPVSISDLTGNPSSNYSFINSFGAANGNFGLWDGAGCNTISSTPTSSTYPASAGQRLSFSP